MTITTPLEQPEKSPTATQLRALRIIHAYSEQSRYRFAITPKLFAKEMWPDSPGWRRSVKCGHGSHRGGGMYIAAGGFLGKLCQYEWVQRDNADGWHGFSLTQKGRGILAQEERSA